MRADQYLLPGLNELAALIHDRNVRLGFYDEDKVRPFDGMMMNVVTEVAEAQEEWRKGRGFTETYWKVVGEPEDTQQILRFNGGKLQIRNYDYDFQPAATTGEVRGTEPEWLDITPELLRRMPGMVQYLKPEGIPSELADIIIRALDVCGFHGIDIAAAIRDKMAFNETRSRRHGGKRS